MAPISCENPLGIGLVRGLACDPICEFSGILAGLFVDPMAFDDKCLFDMRKVQVFVEFGSDPDFAGFNSSMIRWVNSDIIGFLTILKEHLDIVEERGLIAFGGEMIVSLPGFDQIFC